MATKPPTRSIYCPHTKTFKTAIDHAGGIFKRDAGRDPNSIKMKGIVFMLGKGGDSLRLGRLEDAPVSYFCHVVHII